MPDRQSASSIMRPSLAWLALAALLLTGCTPKYTIDDGRKVNETLLNNIRLYGAGEQKLRPSIARSSQLKDKDCSTQWELPFAVATSYDLDEDDRVAWVRALQVDERLSVVSALPESGLSLGDKIAELDGYSRDNSFKMLEQLASLKEDGSPFVVKTANGKQVTIAPFPVCRGYTRLAPPQQPQQQDFHWLEMTHPLEIVAPTLTPDETLWIVLWSQGLSEEAGGRMKTYHYGKKIVGKLLDLATLASGVSAAGQAAKAVSSQALTAAASSASQAASQQVAQKILEQAGRSAAEAAGKEYGEQLAKSLGKSLASQSSSLLQEGLSQRLGFFALSGVSLVAMTALDQADNWAFKRMPLLQADPLVAVSLHRKLTELGLVNNPFALDRERAEKLLENSKDSEHHATLTALLAPPPAAGSEPPAADPGSEAAATNAPTPATPVAKAANEVID